MHITLGVSSSISCYKAAEILRSLQKEGHDVRVAMTRSATRFIRPFLFQSLSRHPVYLDEFKDKKGEVMHVEVARWTDLLLVAPASANLLGKFANGIADDFLSTLFLARRSPVLIAPAMNVYMYRNSAVEQNVQRLKDAGVEVIEPDEGYLACGDEGPGRLAEVNIIVDRALQMLRSARSLVGKHVIVTAGPTWESLDPVRVLTNRSSGKMGYVIAEEAAARGARVTLISGPSQLLPPLNISTFVKVQSATEMKNAVLSVFDSADFVVKAAAVSDFKAEITLAAKRKKTGRPETVTLVPTEDILQLLGEKKTHQILVGFCAETENLEENARKKLERKKLDFIVGNLVSDSHDPFQSDQNEVLVIDRLGNKKSFVLQKKRQLAFNLWEMILERAAEVQTVSTRG